MLVEALLPIMKFLIRALWLRGTQNEGEWRMDKGLQVIQNVYHINL